MPTSALKAIPYIVEFLREEVPHPTSNTFLGKLFDGARLLAVAKQYQDATDFHLKHQKIQE